jgi:hypothetical protein
MTDLMSDREYEDNNSDPMEFQDYKDKYSHRIIFKEKFITIQNNHNFDIPTKNIRQRDLADVDADADVDVDVFPCYYIKTPETTKYDQLEKDMLKSKNELCTCFYKIREKIKNELQSLNLVYSNGSSRSINIDHNDHILYTSSSLDLNEIRDMFLKQINRNIYDDEDKSINILNNTFDVYKDELKNLHDQWLKYRNIFINEGNALYETYKTTYQNVNGLQYRYMEWLSFDDAVMNLIHPLELKLLKNYYNIVLVPKE